MIIINKVKQEEKIEFGLIGKLGKEEDVKIILIKNRRLEVWKIDKESKKVIKEFTERIKKKIKTIKEFFIGNEFGNGLIGIDENNVVFTFYKKEKNYFYDEIVRIKEMVINANEGIEPFIIVGGMNEFVLIYLFEELIVFIDLKMISECLNQKNEQTKKRINDLSLKDQRQIRTFMIDNDVILSINRVIGPKDIFCVLCRNVLYEYMLKYYELNILKNTFKLIEVFKIKDNIAHCFIPLNESLNIVLVTDYFYFFFKTKQIVIKNPKTFDFTINKKKNQFKKTIFSNSSNEHIEFISYEIVNEKKILLSSENGRLFILCLEIDFFPEKLIVNDIYLTELGYFSCIKKLYNVFDNFFFGFSDKSKSTFFKIDFDKNSIHEEFFYHYSPPIIDIKLKTFDNTGLVLICENECNKGIYKSISKTLDLDLKFEVNDLNIENLIFISGSFDFLIEDDKKKKSKFDYFNLKFTQIFDNFIDEKIIYCKLIDFDYLLITNVGVYKNNQLIIKDNIYSGIFLNTNTFIYFNYESLVIRSLDKIQLTIKNYKISNFDAITVNNELFIFLCLTNNTYILYSIVDSTCNLLFSKTVDDDKMINSLCLINNKKENSIYLLLVTFDGVVLQFQFNLTKRELCKFKFSSLNLNKKKLFFKKNDSIILLHNDDSIYFLMFNKILKFYFYVKIVNEVKILQLILNQNNNLIILTKEINLKIYQIKFLSSNDFNSKSHLSNFNILKSIVFQNSKFSIVLNQEIKFESNAFIKKWSYLSLINIEKMSLIDINYLSQINPIDIVDICVLPILNDKNFENLFLALSNDQIHGLLIFSIEENQIILKQKIEYKKFLDTNLSMQSITVFDKDNLIFIISGKINFSIKLNLINDVFELEILSNSFVKSPSYTSCHLSSKNFVIYADLMNELFITIKNKNLNPEFLTIKKVFSNFKHSFLITMDVYSVSKCIYYIMCGDILGNVSVFLYDSRTSKINIYSAFNIEESVIYIKALDNNFDSKEKSYNDSFVKTIGLIGTKSGSLYSLNLIVNDMSSQLLMDFLKHLSYFYLSWKNLNKSDQNDLLKNDYKNIIDLRFLSFKEKQRIFKKYQIYLNKSKKNSHLDVDGESIIFLFEKLNNDCLNWMHN